MTTKLKHNRRTFSQPAEPPSKQQLLSEQLMNWKNLLFLPLFLLLVGGAVFARLRMMNDLRDAPHISGIGTVLDKKFRMNHRGDQFYSVTFRLNEGIITQPTANVEMWEKAKVGDKMHVTYRVGKHGYLQVDSWKPQ